MRRSAIVVAAALAALLPIGAAGAGGPAVQSVKPATASATATRGGYIAPTGRWQVLVSFDAVEGSQVGWPGYSFTAAGLDDIWKLEVRDGIQAHFAAWPVDVQISTAPLLELGPRQMAVHVGREMRVCIPCGGVAWQGGVSLGSQYSHAFVFIDGAAGGPERIACTGAHEIGHLTGLVHTSNGSMMDSKPPPPIPCRWSTSQSAALTKFFTGTT